MIDIVIVIYNEKTAHLAAALSAKLACDPAVDRVIIHDNRVENLGFGKGCNRGASQSKADVIGFLNPDIMLSGTLEAVEETFRANENVMVTGCRFGKSDEQLHMWSIDEGGWVCGAAFFVRRSWFDQLGRFDEQFVFGYEETDFCKRTFDAGFKVLPIDLPITHDSPSDDPVQTIVYKVYWMTRGWDLYKQKHGINIYSTR